MKKLIAALLAVLMLCAVASCASSSDSAELNNPAGSAADNGYTDGYYGEYESNYEYPKDEIADAPMPMPAGEPSYADRDTVSSQIAPVPPETGGTVSPGDKIVYTASANVETLNFDQTITDLEGLISGFGGFIESSYVTGKPIETYVYEDASYKPPRNSSNLRSASYTVRVPKDSFENAKASLDSLGNVTSLSTSANNITGQYTDTESRLKMYTTEEERLLAMLERADTVYDMITIEQTLANVRYNIESLTTSLRAMDTQVAYSTLSVYIREVERLTVVTEPHRSYGQQIVDGLVSTLKNVGRFFADLLKFIIVNIPVIVILALLCIVCYVAIKKRIKKNKIKSETDDKNE